MSESATAGPERPSWVDVHVDPMCPWAYQTSRWLREVRSRTGVEVRWRFFSLEEVNREEGKKHPWEREWSYGWSQMRIGALLRRRGQAEVDRWYEVVGRSFHEEGIKTQDREVHRRLLDQHGFGGDAVDEAIADPTTADEVRADHERAVGTFGGFGVPIIVMPPDWYPDPTRPAGRAVYGPVTVPPPTGADAEALWDLTLAFSRVEGLYELKRPKTRADLMAIATVFEPYLRARDWRTIENPAP